MRCGNCKGSHDSVADVRECFNGAPVPPSPKQVSLAQALGSERTRLPGHAGMAQLDYEMHIQGLSRRDMRTFIDRMLKQPHAGLSRDELFTSVENGRYALRNLDDDDIRFYLISGTRTRILWELTGAPGDFKQQRIYRPEKILKRIAENPLASYILFGLNVGQCGRCGSPLTKKHTRERGIGDTCYGKLMAGNA